MHVERELHYRHLLVMKLPDVLSEQLRHQQMSGMQDTLCLDAWLANFFA